MTSTRRDNTKLNGDHVIIRKRKNISQSNVSTSSINASQTAAEVTHNNPQLNNLSSMKIAHLNINGLRNKVDLLSVELSEYDIICVSETKLNNLVETAKLKIDGFHDPIRRDRQYNNGGGLLVYIKNNIHFKRRPDIENQYIENIWIQVCTLNKQFLMGLFYRPPGSTVDYWESFESCLETASDQNLDMIIMGDFNHDLMIQNNLTKLERIICKFNIENVFTEPTRITDTTQTCLDLVLTNHTSIIENTDILAPFCSDHCTITADITFKTYKEKTYKTKFWKYEEADNEAIENKVNSTDWSYINNSYCNNIDEINEIFAKFIIDTANQFIPSVNYTKRPTDKPWMNNNIRKQIRQRDRLFKKAKLKKSVNYLNNYKDKRNEVITSIREAKANYLQKLKDTLSDSKTPPKQWYKIANEISSLKNKRNPPPPLRNNNNTVDIHPFDKAQTLNKHFANISKVDNPPPLPEEEPTPPYALESITVTEKDVKDQLHALKTSKPGGPDEISPKLIKALGNSLAKPLMLLFNKSLSLGQVPSDWKMANISAIFKGKGDSSDPTNYRPISITSCIGKMLEKIIFKYLYNYLETNQLITNFQSGFRPKDSTVNQLLEILNAPLWYNKKLINGHSFFINEWYKKDIRQVSDLLNEQGNMFDFEALKTRYGIRGTFLEYEALKNKIPNRWKNMLNDNTTTCITNRFNVTCNIYLQFVLKDKKGCRRFYDLMLQSKKIELNDKWMQEFGFIDTDEYKHYNKIIASVKEIKLKDFQFKVINKILVTKSFLYRINKTDNNICEYCNQQTETIYHLFVECEIVKQFWNELQLWLNTHSTLTLNLDGKQIIFSNQDRRNTIRNYLSIIAKHYIYTTKFTQKTLRIDNFINLLKKKFQSEKYIALMNNTMTKFFAKWAPLYNYFNTNARG